jgi:hypothetical protein
MESNSKIVRNGRRLYPKVITLQPTMMSDVIIIKALLSQILKLITI